MIVTQTVRADKREVIPAVTHVDQTGPGPDRAAGVNPRYWQLISEFERLTGVPVILNTSFNLRGEPIVCTPQDGDLDVSVGHDRRRGLASQVDHRGDAVVHGHRVSRCRGRTCP